MFTINADGVNDALVQGARLAYKHGRREASRNGDVLRVPMPVTTVTWDPRRRVLLHPWRDANPFFHVVEAMWMLAGRDDLKALTPYARQMAEYSDDRGVTQPGAYGRRWRHFTNQHGTGDEDQLDWAVKRLRANPGDRRVVIQMWNPLLDMEAADYDSKDVPCNLTCLPWVSEQGLALTVFCRSNDLVWGAHGANAVHLSVLQEYLAARIGIDRVGPLVQVSNNYHGYVKTMPAPEHLKVDDQDDDQYMKRGARYTPLFNGASLGHVDVDPTSPRGDQLIREDLTVLFEDGPFACAHMARWAFLRRVVIPMMLAHQHWRTRRGEDRYLGALEILAQMPERSDWRVAAEEWVQRRHARWTAKADGGVPHDDA